MASPHFQFTIRNLFWATFWVAVSMASWMFYFGPHQPFTMGWVWSLPLAVVTAVFAIMALFGRGKLAFWVIVACATLAIALIVARAPH